MLHNLRAIFSKAIVLWKTSRLASKGEIWTMDNQYSLPVVHPAFELLKKWTAMLHFIAASLILINAIAEMRAPNSTAIFYYAQVIIAADIYLLIFFGAGVWQAAPRINLLFRIMETLTLLGIGLSMLLKGDLGIGFSYLLISMGYVFIYYRERRVMHSESVSIRPTGISLPNFMRDSEISWNEIRSIIPKYHSIIIETLRNKRIRFELRRNLKIEELQQIDDFCQKHICHPHS